MDKKPSSSNSRLLLGIVVGYLVGEQLVRFQELPHWQTYMTVITVSLFASAGFALLTFPARIPAYKYWLGQFGAWLASLLIGGWLPLVREVVYSLDFWTILLLLPIHIGILYSLLLVQRGFDTPRPGHTTSLSELSKL